MPAHQSMSVQLLSWLTYRTKQLAKKLPLGLCTLLRPPLRAVGRVASNVLSRVGWGFARAAPPPSCCSCARPGLSQLSQLTSVAATANVGAHSCTNRRSAAAHAGGLRGGAGVPECTVLVAAGEVLVCMHACTCEGLMAITAEPRRGWRSPQPRIRSPVPACPVAPRWQAAWLRESEQGGPLQAEVAAESGRVAAFTISREIEAPERFQACIWEGGMALECICAPLAGWSRERPVLAGRRAKFLLMSHSNSSLLSNRPSSPTELPWPS